MAAINDGATPVHEGIGDRIIDVPGLDAAELKYHLDRWQAPIPKRIAMGKRIELMTLRAESREWLTAKGVLVERPLPNPTPVTQGNPRPGLKVVGSTKTEWKPRLLTVSMADVKEEPVDWLWPGRFPSGTVSIVAGKPEAGKSTLSGFLASIVTTGGTWPDCKVRYQGRRRVLMLTGEENLAQSVAPRLHRLGADVGLVNVITGAERSEGQSYTFRFARDLDLIDALLDRFGDVGLITIDPVGAYIGLTDSNDEASVRDSLAPLFSLAERRRLAVVLFLHIKKNGMGDVMSQVANSFAFVAMPRKGWYLSKHPNDRNVRVLSHLKSNLCCKDDLKTGLSYGLDQGLPDWHRDPIDWDADEVSRMLYEGGLRDEVSGDRGPKAAKAIAAVEFLETLLSKICSCSQAYAQAEAQKISVPESSFLKGLKRATATRGTVERFKPPGRKHYWLRLAEVQQELPLESGAKEGASR